MYPEKRGTSVGVDVLQHVLTYRPDIATCL